MCTIFTLIKWACLSIDNTRQCSKCLFWGQISWKKFVFFRNCKSRFISSFLFRIILSLFGMLCVALCLGIFVLFYTQFIMDLHNLQISGQFFLATVSLNLFLRSSDSDSYIFQTRPLVWKTSVRSLFSQFVKTRRVNIQRPWVARDGY